MTVSLVSARSHKRWFPATAILCALAILSPITTTAAAGTVEGNFTLMFARVDHVFEPGYEYLLEFDIDLSDSVASVIATAPDETSLVFFDFDGSGGQRWGTEVYFFTLSDLQQFSHGTWTISIFGGPGMSSTSTFTLNANAIAPADLFPLPTILSPPPNAVNISPCPTVNWTSPAGGADADIMGVAIWDVHFTDEQEALNIFGTLDTSATSWKPPNPLAPGFHELAVFYAMVDSAGLASALTVTSGAIDWGDSQCPFDLDEETCAVLDGYPPFTPLLLLFSETIIEFHVSAATPCKAGDLTGNGAVGVFDLLTLLGAWGQCTNCSPVACPADLDGNCTVNVFDLLVLLGSWG